MQRPETGPRPRLRGGRVVIVKDGVFGEVALFDFSFSGRNGRSLKLSGIHAPSQSFISGGCSGLSRKSPVRM